MNVYGDNRNIIADGVPEMETYMNDVLPKAESGEMLEDGLLDILPAVEEYLPEMNIEE